MFTCHGITFDNYINVTEKYFSVVIFQYNSYIKFKPITRSDWINYVQQSVSWLLMALPLASPGHQYPWYWLCRIDKFSSYMGRISTTCVMSVWRNDMICRYIFMLSMKHLANKRLRYFIIRERGMVIRNFFLHSHPFAKMGRGCF